MGQAFLGVRRRASRSEGRFAQAGMLLLACIGLSSPAGAANSVTPRVPPVFDTSSCLEIVERAQGPIALPFAIPFENVALTDDELEDSRRLQFFALCRDQHRDVQPMPQWINRDDVERSIMAGIIAEPPEAREILEDVPAWRDCALAMNAADARIPMTCDATIDGVTWFLEGVPAGNYVLRGYSFEPATNLWTPRPGVIQVRDGEILPGVALVTPGVSQQVAFEHAGPSIEGCAVGPPGTRVELAWARMIDLRPDESDAPEAWTVFASFDVDEELPAAFQVEFQPPAQAVNQAIVFRAESVGPTGLRWQSYAPGKVLVYAGDGEPSDGRLPRGLDHCGVFEGLDPVDTDEEHEDDASTSDAGGANEDCPRGEDGDCRPVPEHGACRCVVNDTGRTDAWLAFALAAIFVRRRPRGTNLR